MPHDPQNLNRTAIAHALDENDRLIDRLAERVDALERAQTGRPTSTPKGPTKPAETTTE